MIGRIFLVVFILYSVSNLSRCTKLSGMLADKRMNMNVLKMFDRFFHLRHKDAFFIRNFEKYLTDDYLKSYYTEEFEMTATLKRDLSMHATYLENTVWYTTSITELFTVLYTKYLAANHIMSFIHCHWYYTYGEKIEEKATKCKKVANFLYAFMKISAEKYIIRMENFLYFIEGGRDDDSRPYRNLSEAFHRYFTHITAVMVRDHIHPEVPDNKDEFLRKLLLLEKEFEQDARLTLKYFFRNIFFDTPKIDYDFLKNKVKEEEIVFDKKKSNNVHIETIKYWEIMDKLVKRIEERDPRTPKLITRKTVKGDSVTEKLIKSNAVEIIRKLEVRDLVIRGIEPSNLSKLKSGSEAEVFQFTVERVFDGTEVRQKFKFVPLQPDNLKWAMTNVFANDYSQMGEVLLEGDFSVEARDVISAENYNSFSAEIAQSATNESFVTDAGSFISSNQSFRTINNSLMKSSASRSVYASNQSYNKSNASMKSASVQILDESQLKANQAAAAEIRRNMAIRASTQAADRSLKVNFSRPGDISHLASYMAPDKRGNTSNYADVSQNVSRSNIGRDHSEYFDNFSKESRYTSSQMIAA